MVKMGLRPMDAGLPQPYGSVRSRFFLSERYIFLDCNYGMTESILRQARYIEGPKAILSIATKIPFILVSIILSSG